MRWVTRKRIQVNRAATAWLVRRFDAAGARYPHRDEQGRCSFEMLVEEHCADDAALKELARIIHGADLDESEISLKQRRCVGGP